MACSKPWPPRCHRGEGSCTRPAIPIPSRDLPPFRLSLDLGGEGGGQTWACGGRGIDLPYQCPALPLGLGGGGGIDLTFFGLGPNRLLCLPPPRSPKGGTTYTMLWICLGLGIGVAGLSPPLQVDLPYQSPAPADPGGRGGGEGTCQGKQRLFRFAQTPERKSFVSKLADEPRLGINARAREKGRREPLFPPKKITPTGTSLKPMATKRRCYNHPCKDTKKNREAANRTCDCHLPSVRTDRQIKARGFAAHHLSFVCFSFAAHDLPALGCVHTWIAVKLLPP